MFIVRYWVLSVELDGEWEECSFTTRNEAVAAFRALARDYTAALKKAILAVNPRPGQMGVSRAVWRANDQYVN
jgi:hypothetical protein